MMRRVLSGVLAMGLLAAAPDVRTLMTAQHIPGMEIVVIDHGKIVRDSAYGVRNVATRQAVDPGTGFEIGSITKQFTAAAILQLKERGKLSLGDPLRKYVPAYFAARKVTISQLLLQVSGIPDYTETKAFGKLVAMHHGKLALAHPGSFEQIVAMIKDMPLAFQPGTKFQYSNSNYVLLGHIVELASGMSWNQYIERNIFKPAGMEHSSFMEDESHIADMATGYTSGQTCAHFVSHCHGDFIPTGTFLGWALGAGAIVSTATDLARWDFALLGGKIIGKDDVRLMMTPAALPAFNANSHYAFGWVIDRHDNEARVWHNGGTFGFTATNELYPDLGQGIIVLVNTTAANADNLAMTEFDRLHPALAQSQSVAAAGEDPAVTARAKMLFAQFATGNVDRSQLTPQMNQAMTPSVLETAKTQFTALGSPTKWVYRGSQAAGGQTTYAYRVSFATGVSLNVYMTVETQGGKIGGYDVSPN
jgi:D-alanyl-D-alanine carboxypeptidase